MKIFAHSACFLLVCVGLKAHGDVVVSPACIPYRGDYLTDQKQKTSSSRTNLDAIHVPGGFSATPEYAQQLLQEEDDERRTAAEERLAENEERRDERMDEESSEAGVRAGAIVDAAHSAETLETVQQAFQQSTDEIIEDCNDVSPIEPQNLTPFRQLEQMMAGDVPETLPEPDSDVAAEIRRSFAASRDHLDEAVRKLFRNAANSIIADAVAPVTNSVTDSAEAIVAPAIEGNVKPSAPMDLVVTRGESLLQPKIDAVEDKIADRLNESLRSDDDRLQGDRWAGALGDSVVRDGVQYVAKIGLNEVRMRVADYLSEKFGNVVAGPVDPDAPEVVRADRELQIAASAPSLLLRTMLSVHPIDGLRAYANEVNSKFNTLFRLATGELERDDETE